MKTLQFSILTLLFMMLAAGLAPADHWQKLQSEDLTVGINADLTLAVYQASDTPVWETLVASRPAIDVRFAGEEAAEKPKRFFLGDAADRVVTDYEDGSHTGYRIRLCGLPSTDVEVELIFALGNKSLKNGGELLVQVAQVGGRDTVQRVAGLYDWTLKSAADAHTIVPRASGYIIRSDAIAAVQLSGYLGGAFSMPLIAMFDGDQTCYQIVETWWDAHLNVNHVPGRGTTMSLDWEASLGRLDYPRRVLFRFAQNLDHVGVAKGYRQYLIDRGEFSTLAERAENTPALKEFLKGAEYRWTHRELDRPDEEKLVLANIRHFQEAGIPISFFYPKWPTESFSPLTPNSAGWQVALLDEPSPGGWPAQVELLKKIHELECAVKVMIQVHQYNSEGPGFEAAKSRGKSHAPWNMSQRYAAWATDTYLDSLRQRGFHFEALYIDGYAAHVDYGEVRDAEGPLTRRQFYETQVDCFQGIRERGIVPGAELARFWAIPGCDFFFFTDWSRDRLREGEPIPLFHLVYHDCYAAHFSGGGYYDEGKYDWYADRHPRLYELMYCAIPSHNWLPGGSRPIEETDWGTEKMNRRLKWLKRWHSWFQKVCYSEMTSHRFLNDNHTLQRVEFANGVVGDFDLADGRFRIQSVPGFSGEWEQPEEVLR